MLQLFFYSSLNSPFLELNNQISKHPNAKDPQEKARKITKLKTIPIKLIFCNLITIITFSQDYKFNRILPFIGYITNSL